MNTFLFKEDLSQEKETLDAFPLFLIKDSFFCI